MKKLFLSVITFLSLAVVAQEKVLVDANLPAGQAGAQKRTLNSSFTAITVSDGVDLYLTQGNDESIAVSASEEKFMERFKTEVVNGTLKIFYDNDGIKWATNSKRKLTAYVSFKTLEKLDASGGADVNLAALFTGDKLAVKVTSGASLNGQVAVKDLSAELNSGASIKITGNAANFTVDVSSGAIFKSYDLATEYCNAKASSGGGIQVTINKELNAKANSGGGIKYKGDAVIRDLNVNSGGSVKKA